MLFLYLMMAPEPKVECRQQILGHKKNLALDLNSHWTSYRQQTSLSEHKLTRLLCVMSAGMLAILGQ